MSHTNNNEELLAERLNRDPRVAEAKSLLKKVLEEYQNEIVGIRGPISEKITSYKELLEGFSELRGGKLWYPFLGSGFGKGALVELVDGSIKYDFIIGIGPHIFGHSHPLLLDAGVDAALSDTVMQGNLQQNIDSLTVIKQLVELSGLDHVILSTSGAMANENALKIALQKKTPAHRILAFDHCFAGRTLALSQLTDKPAYREGLPTTINVDYIPFYDEKDPEGSAKKTIEALKNHIKHHPKEHALLCIELVQGEGGFYFGTKEYYREVLSFARAHGIIIFDDEVQCFGRTEKLFAFQHFGIEDLVDIVSIGKLSQVCATLFRKEMLPKPGLISQTFTGSTSAIKAAIVLLEQFTQQNCFGPEGKMAQIHNRFVEQFAPFAKEHPHLMKGPFGIGSMVAFTPLDGSPEKVKEFSFKLFEAGVMGFIAGSEPTRIRFLVPALGIRLEDIDAVANIVKKVLLNYDHS